MSQAELAEPLWGRAYPRSTLQGCLRRQWPEHLTSGRLGTQSCEDVSGESGLNTTSGRLATQSCEDVSCESGRTTLGQGISEARVVRMSQAKAA